MAELFDPSLKKKKKKSVAFNEDPLSAQVDPTTPADVDDANGHDLGPKTVHERVKQNGSPANGDGDDGKPEDDEFKAMFGDLKKKKKKKDISADVDEEPSASAATKEPAAAEDLDFSEIKKKKKSKKKAAADLEAFEKELGEAKEDEDEDEDGADMDFQDEHDDLVDDIFDRGGDVVVEGAEPWAGSDRDYTYSELLRRFYTQLHAQNPSLLSATGKRHTIPPPVIHREGKKSVFANVTEICKRMRRPPDHVIQYLFSEMGTTGSVDGAGRLVIKGRFQQKQVEHVLRGYIVEYVICKTCKSPDTQLTKENRIFFTTCESCGSRRSVNAIKSGFQAQVGRRSRMKTG